MLKTHDYNKVTKRIGIECCPYNISVDGPKFNPEESLGVAKINTKRAWISKLYG